MGALGDGAALCIIPPIFRSLLMYVASDSSNLHCIDQDECQNLLGRVRFSPISISATSELAMHLVCCMALVVRELAHYSMYIWTRLRLVWPEYGTVYVHRHMRKNVRVIMPACK